MRIYLMKLKLTKVWLYVCYCDNKNLKTNRISHSRWWFYHQDGSPIKKTDDVVGPTRDQNKSVINYAFWWKLQRILANFVLVDGFSVWINIFWPFTWMVDIFFRYGHVRFDTNVNPEVPVFDINREPVLAPIAKCNFQLDHEMQQFISCWFHNIAQL